MTLPCYPLPGYYRKRLILSLRSTGIGKIWQQQAAPRQANNIFISLTLGTTAWLRPLIIFIVFRNRRLPKIPFTKQIKSVLPTPMAPMMPRPCQSIIQPGTFILSPSRMLHPVFISCLTRKILPVTTRQCQRGHCHLMG